MKKQLSTIYCLPPIYWRSCRWSFCSKIWWNEMSPINATQTIMTELSEHFCQRSVHWGQMAERAKEEKETDDRKEWGKRRTRWKTGWFGLSLAFHIKLWTQTTHTGTNTVNPHINTKVFTPDSEPNQWLWSNINMVPSIATCGTME